MTDQYAPAEGLGVTLEGGVLRLRLDRADKRNALTDDMIGR